MMAEKSSWSSQQLGSLRSSGNWVLYHQSSQREALHQQDPADAMWQHWSRMHPTVQCCSEREHQASLAIQQAECNLTYQEWPGRHEAS